MGMPKSRLNLTICMLFLCAHLQAESFRTVVESSVEITPERPAGGAASIGINGSLLISLGAEARFLSGIEIEVSAPQAWISYRGSLAMSVYNSINPKTASGTADMDGSRITFEALPSKLQIIYQIPVRPSHGLRTTPYVTVASSVTPADTFPILFRLMPVIKGITDELEKMIFNITVKPILSGEGAVRLIPRYPPQLRGRPFTVLIDDVLISNISEQYMLKEGEHHLVILSEDYRNESRRFVVERAKITDLAIELQDPTPLIIFEGPQNARIFLDNVPVPRQHEPVAVEPGQHEAKFQLGDYTVVKTLNIQRGKTYRVAMEVDLTVHEED
jgi:hypothetical protein